MQRAVQLVESYFLPMAKRAFGEAAIPAPELHAMTLARWLREQQAEKFNAREARRQIAGKLRAAAEMERACAALVEAGLIRPRPSRAGGQRDGCDATSRSTQWCRIPLFRRANSAKSAKSKKTHWK